MNNVLEFKKPKRKRPYDPVPDLVNQLIVDVYQQSGRKIKDILVHWDGTKFVGDICLYKEGY